MNGAQQIQTQPATISHSHTHPASLSLNFGSRHDDNSKNAKNMSRRIVYLEHLSLLHRLFVVVFFICFVVICGLFSSCGKMCRAISVIINIIAKHSVEKK